MTLPVLLDARILAYNDTGISRYVRHLYRAMRDVVAQAIESGAPPPVQVTLLESRREKLHHLSQAWPERRVAITPPHHRLEKWALAAEVGAAAWSIQKSIRTSQRSPVIVHSPDHVTPGQYRALGADAWRSVVTVHDLSFLRIPETHSEESRAYYSGMKSSVLSAGAIICPSHATARDLFDMTRVDPARVWVIPEAPDPRFHPSEVPPSSVANSSRPYILTVGTIEARKNVKTLIRAVAQIAPGKRPQVKIVGSRGSAFEEAASLVSSCKLDNDVSFLGRIGTEEIIALYQNATVSMYLSLYEGFGLPVLEAMACGCPVVASNASSIPEVAGDAAVLVDPNDVDSIVGAMVRLLDDPAHRADLRFRGLARAATFTWEAAARRTIDAFQAASA